MTARNSHHRNRPMPWLAIALCLALAGCGKRQSELEATTSPLMSQECQYVGGYRICMIRFNDGRVCRTYAGSMQCDPPTPPTGQAK